MVNHEIFSENAIKNISSINKHVVEKRPESFGVDDPSLITKIFERVNQYYHIPNKKVRLIKRASHVLAGIIFEQPFKNGNKSTAYIVTQHYLKINGLTFSANISDDEVIQLLESISPFFLNEDQYDIAFSSAEDFLNNNIILK
ncbi:MAG: Fic family protein [Nitrosopumilaceae archaeon]|nr:Fic family protein [Nitrosopumilaceae archaeon]